MGREHAKQLRLSENARIDLDAKVKGLSSKVVGLEAYAEEREKRISELME